MFQSFFKNKSYNVKENHNDSISWGGGYPDN